MGPASSFSQSARTKIEFLGLCTLWFVGSLLVRPPTVFTYYALWLWLSFCVHVLLVGGLFGFHRVPLFVPALGLLFAETFLAILTGLAWLGQFLDVLADSTSD